MAGTVENALDAKIEKISAVRFGCSEREVCSSNIRRVMAGNVENAQDAKMPKSNRSRRCDTPSYGRKR